MVWRRVVALVLVIFVGLVLPSARLADELSDSTEQEMSWRFVYDEGRGKERGPGKRERLMGGWGELTYKATAGIRITAAPGYPKMPGATLT